MDDAASRATLDSEESVYERGTFDIHVCTHSVYVLKEYRNMQSLLTVSTPDADDDFRNDREALQNARVVATEVRAPCSCIPPLSSKNVSSMIYESVTCKHHDVTGPAHRGVVFAKDHWGDATQMSSLPHLNDVEFHKNKRSKQRVPNTRVVASYPHNIALDSDSDSLEDDDSDDDDDVTFTRAVRQPRATMTQARDDVIGEDELEADEDDANEKRRFSLDRTKTASAKKKQSGVFAVDTILTWREAVLCCVDEVCVHVSNLRIR